jgi:uncharacterized membrane protein YedE/YeeE
MNTDDALMGLVGGAFIGLAATLLLTANGRIAGISGILGGLGRRGDRTWKLAFLVGLVGAGLLLAPALPHRFIDTTGNTTLSLVLGGLLVGFGTRLGSGCTSGHGVCGLSAGSKRSLTATMTFMGCAGITVYVVKHLMGGLS